MAKFKQIKLKKMSKARETVVFATLWAIMSIIPKMSLGKIWTNTLLLAPFRDPLVGVLLPRDCAHCVRSAPRLSIYPTRPCGHCGIICPLQGHYRRSRIEPCDKSFRQKRELFPKPDDIFGINGRSQPMATLRAAGNGPPLMLL